MLFPSSLWPGLREGRITLAFRRWRRPTVKAGGTLQSPAGLLAIDAVEVVTDDDITDAAATAAGYDRAASVRATLRPTGTLMRVRFHRAGDDPRVALREQPLADAEADELSAKLEAIDRRAATPWTHAVLTTIRDHEGVRAADLAAQLQLEKDDLKVRVRRLENLGLTESLETGYRLSPRGLSLLTRAARTRTQGTRPVSVKRSLEGE